MIEKAIDGISSVVYCFNFYKSRYLQTTKVKYHIKIRSERYRSWYDNSSEHDSRPLYKGLQGFKTATTAYDHGARLNFFLVRCPFTVFFCHFHY